MHICKEKIPHGVRVDDVDGRFGVWGFGGLGREQQVKSPLQHPLLKKNADSSLFSVEGFLVMLYLLLCQMAGFFKVFVVRKPKIKVGQPNHS